MSGILVQDLQKTNSMINGRRRKRGPAWVTYRIGTRPVATCGGEERERPFDASRRPAQGQLWPFVSIPLRVSVLSSRPVTSRRGGRKEHHHTPSIWSRRNHEVHASATEANGVCQPTYPTDGWEQVASWRPIGAEPQHLGALSRRRSICHSPPAQTCETEMSAARC